MALRDQPYLPLYVQDYLTDEKLNMCSPAAQGVYIKIMCILHKQETYGEVVLFKQKDKQKSSMIENFALRFTKLLPFTYDDILSALSELTEEAVLIIDGDRIYQPRMVKDNRISEARSKAAKKGGGNPNLFKLNPKQRDKQNTEYENEYENENNNVSIKEDCKEEKPKKLKYADFVSMLPEEHEKLRLEFGDSATTRMVEILNNYKGAKGKKYKSDYLAIRNWVITRYKEEANGSRNYNRNEGISRIVTSTQTRKTTIPD